jgi:hypothetical protein
MVGVLWWSVLVVVVQGKNLEEPTGLTGVFDGRAVVFQAPTRIPYLSHKIIDRCGVDHLRSPLDQGELKHF